jgi:hypothetical protein
LRWAEAAKSSASLAFCQFLVLGITCLSAIKTASNALRPCPLFHA